MAAIKVDDKHDEAGTTSCFLPTVSFSVHNVHTGQGRH